GLFLSYPNKQRIEQILSDPRYDGIRCIVVSDGERILGLGDQGAGGMGIPIGKMALYTALAGIRPEWCLPILLDVGTDNEQRLAVFGFGAAGMGITELIVSAMREAGLGEKEARARFYALDRYGLIVEDGQGVRPEQEPFARRRSELSAWQISNPANIGLPEVVRNAKPTVLIGASGQPGAFTEEAIRAMAKTVERPIVFPLSNPVSRCEATPQQLVDWTEGRALIGTGSPFPPASYQGRPAPFAQTNNSYIFPGLALGILSSRARHVSDAMVKAATLALVELLPTRRDKQAPLLPPLKDLRAVS